MLMRWDCAFPTLYQIRRQGLFTTPIAYGTAQLAALFVKHFPRGRNGVLPPEALPAEVVSAILADTRARHITIAMRTQPLRRPRGEEDEF